MFSQSAQLISLSVIRRTRIVSGVRFGGHTGSGHFLARHLFASGLEIKTVNPVLVKTLRKYETHPEKSDLQDAYGVAKVLIEKIDTLPTYRITEQSEIGKEIKDLSLDRAFLIKEQSRIKNHLHRLLHRAWNSAYRDKFKDPFGKKSIKYWSAHPLPCGKAANDIIGTPAILKNQIRRKVKRLADIRKEVKEIETELQTLIEKTGQKITTLSGCGTVLGAMILAEVKGVERFSSPSALAKYAGLSPREKSSGKTFRHVKTKSGNRQLNSAIHRVALSQIGRSGNQHAKAYFQRKISEGKTKTQALCCLKRRLVDIIYIMLKHAEPYKEELHTVS